MCNLHSGIPMVASKEKCVLARGVSNYPNTRVYNADSTLLLVDGMISLPLRNKGTVVSASENTDLNISKPVRSFCKFLAYFEVIGDEFYFTRYSFILNIQPDHVTPSLETLIILAFRESFGFKQVFLLRSY